MILGHDLNAALIMTYEWLKAAHVIFVIFWIAGLFLLPRYYVYHQEAEVGAPEEARWIEREAKLRNIILAPAMILVWLLGLSLAYVTNAWAETWLQLKLAAVILLSAYHGWLIGYGRKLAKGERPIDGRTLRMLNELPGILTALIVILVVVKPF